MIYLKLQDFQLVLGYIFLGLLFILILGVGLVFIELKNTKDENGKTDISNFFSDGIQDRNAPYPLLMVLIIAGAFVWGILYFVMHGLLEAKI